MGKNYVDQYFKDQLIDHEVNIDNDLLWAAIERKKSNSKSWLLGLSIIAICLISFGIYQFSNNGSDSFVSIKVDNFQKSGNVVASSNLNEEIVAATKPFKTESQTKNLETTNKLLSTNDNLTKNDNKNNSKDLSIEKNKQVKSSIKNYNSNKANKNNSTKIGKEIPREKKLNTQKANTFASSKKVINTKNSNPLFESSAVKSSTADINRSGLKFNTSNTSISSNSTANSSTIRNFNSKELESINTINSFLKSPKPYFPNNNGTDCPTFGPRKKNIFVQGYTFLDYVASSFSTTNDFNSYLNSRKSTQSYRPSYRLGAQIKYVLDNGIYIKGGLEYGAINERFAHRLVDTTTTVLPDQLIAINIDSNGDTTRVFGNAPVTIIESKKWRVKNSYTSIGIPVLLGYQIHKGKWTYGLEAGIISNLSFNFKGMLIDELGTPIEPVDYFKDNIKMSVTGGLSLAYALKPNISILMMAQFKNNLQNINSTINVVDQKNLTIGLGIGVEYRI